LAAGFAAAFLAAGFAAAFLAAGFATAFLTTGFAAAAAEVATMDGLVCVVMLSPFVYEVLLNQLEHNKT
jgi:hypothetical protein